MCGERNKAMEVTLNSARRIEVCLGDRASEGDVKRRMDVAFTRAYKEGKFKASNEPTKEVFVGPNRLPQALSPDLTPQKVQGALGEALENGQSRSEAAEFVANRVAKSFNWQLKRVDEADIIVPTVHPYENKCYNPGCDDIALWGTLVVYDSDEDAWQSLTVEEQESQTLRLIKVADNRQLSKVLEPGKELCGRQAGLFLRVADTCPGYYALWDSDASRAHMEVVSKLPNFGSRQDFLSKFVMDGTADLCPVRLRLRKTVVAGKNTSAIFVDPGCLVVRCEGYHASEVDSASSSLPESSGSSGVVEDEEGDADV